MNAASLKPKLLEHKPHGRKNTFWWGIIMMVTIEIALFGLLIAAYFFMKLRSPEWPPLEAGKPELFLPTLNTAVLVASGLSMWYGDQAIKQGNQKGLLIGQTVALLLAVVFVYLKYTEYSGLSYQWNSHTYGSMVWLMAGFHTAHVISVFLKGLLVYAMAWMGVYTKEEHVAVEVNGVYWQFVVVIWIPLYLTIYISPYVL
ncbi:MAG: cytochrome c oxidase subunit 3 [Deinococcus sp.]|nr:cytochrome c oxidase subunit 3 [Deinococcus sp.]